jgi:uncharacterized membrane protein
MIIKVLKKYLFLIVILISSCFLYFLINVKDGFLVGNARYYIAYFLFFIIGIVSFYFLNKKFSLVERVAKINDKTVRKVLLYYCIAYFVVITLAILYKHFNFRTALFDFGLEQQVVNNTSNGNWFQSSVEVSNYMGDHFSLIIVFISAIYKIFPSFLTLYILQSLAVVIAVFGIFKLAFLILKNAKQGLLIAIIFSLYIPISGLYLFDWHPITYALPLLVWAIYYYFKKRNWISLILFFFASLCKEDVNVFIFGFGLFLLLRKEKLGFVYFVYGALMSYLTLFVFIPYFRNGPSDTLLRYGYLGSNLSEIIKTLITNPFILISHNFVLAKFLYLVKLFWPLLLLPLKNWRYIILFLPSLFLNFIVDSEFQSSGAYHYDAMISVGIFVAFILNFKEIQKNALSKSSLNAKFNLKKFVLVLVVVNFLWFGMHPIIKIPFIPRFFAQYQDLMELKKDIPKDMVVGVPNMIGAHFGDYTNLRLTYPFWILNEGVMDYIVFDKFIEYKPFEIIEIDTFKQNLLSDNYSIYKDTGYFQVLKRTDE